MSRVHENRHRRRWLRVALVVVVVGVAVAPVAVVASHRFTDVPDSNIFHDDIAWLADAGVTLGCNPPDNDEFCPSEFVSREQMAAFMRRLAGAGVVDADTVDGLHASEIAAGDHVHDGGDIVDGSLTGADISDGSLTGADIGDESVTGADIDNNTVSNVDTSNEPGVVFNSSTTQVSATSTPTAMISTSIRVPSDGWVKIEATGKWVNIDTGFDIADCQLQKGTVGAIDSSEPSFRLDDLGTGVLGIMGFSAHRVVPISVADNPPFITAGQSLHLVCDELSGDVRLRDLHISGTFYATSYAPLGILLP